MISQETLTILKEIGLWIENHGLALFLVLYYLRKIQPEISKIQNPQKEYLENLKNNREANVQKGQEIREILSRIMYGLGADRAYLFQFHNGGINLGGIEFLKLSNTHEVVNSGIRPQIKNLQQLPISAFANFVKSVGTGKPFYVHNVEDLKDKDLGLYETLTMQGIKSIYAVGVYDYNNSPLGFVGIDYTKQVTDLTTAQQNTLENASYQISGYLYK